MRPVNGQSTLSGLREDISGVANRARLQVHPGRPLTARSSSFENPRSSVTLVGDNTLPHFIDGASFQTTVTLVNLESRSIHLQVLFFQDNGKDLTLPLAGLSGTYRGVDITLAARGTKSFSTDGTSSAYSSGWALLNLDDYNDAVSGFSVFRQRVSGRPDFEATVPIVDQFQGHFVIPYDETNGYFTGVAIANPTLLPASIPVTIYDDTGKTLSTQLMSLQGYGHTAFLIRDSWPLTVV